MLVDLGPVDAGPDADDPDLLDPHEEILTSDAAAVRWWVEPTTGVRPELADALRVDAVDLDATDESRGRLRVRWAVSVRITDVRLLRQHADDRADLAEAHRRSLEPGRRPLRTCERSARRHLDTRHRRDHSPEGERRRTASTPCRRPRHLDR